MWGVHSKHQSFGPKDYWATVKWLLKDFTILSSHRFALFELTYFPLPGRVVSDVTSLFVPSECGLLAGDLDQLEHGLRQDPASFLGVCFGDFLRGKLAGKNSGRDLHSRSKFFTWIPLTFWARFERKGPSPTPSFFLVSSETFLGCVSGRISKSVSWWLFFRVQLFSCHFFSMILTLQMFTVSLGPELPISGPFWPRSQPPPPS